MKSKLRLDSKIPLIISTTCVQYLIFPCNRFITMGLHLLVALSLPLREQTIRSLSSVTHVNYAFLLSFFLILWIAYEKQLWLNNTKISYIISTPCVQSLLFFHVIVLSQWVYIYLLVAFPLPLSQQTSRSLSSITVFLVVSVKWNNLPGATSKQRQAYRKESEATSYFYRFNWCCS